MGSYYGALGAHQLLWSLCRDTKDSLAARLALVPLVQEARGLDAGPRFIDQLLGKGDVVSAAVLGMIVREEERHVSSGLKWFGHLCGTSDESEQAHEFRRLVRKHVPRGLFPPFNVVARERCGLREHWYLPLVPDDIDASKSRNSDLDAHARLASALQSADSETKRLAAQYTDLETAAQRHESLHLVLSRLLD
ncbi:MAG: hypothetical protein MHM6MM_007739 [Cercozoa sp. M6MM]